MTSGTVLIIEDEPDMALGLRDNCEYEGYRVLVARDGEEGVRQATEAAPDIILLDIMLPRMSGLDVCRALRKKGVETPIIMLTAKGQELDKVVGLEVGADDYVTKPFSIQELLARIRAHLRRASRQVTETETYELGEIELNFKKYTATKGGEPLRLSPREFHLLRYFIQHRDEVVTREQLLNDVWGYDNYPMTRTVDNHIAKLRQKIEEDPTNPRRLLTVHRLGYKFVA